MENIFDSFTEKLEQKGIITRSGSIVDATFVDVPKQRNTKAENKEIKIKYLANGKMKKTGIAQKDTDARWMTKNKERHYRYKAHVKIDKKSKIITKYRVTSGEVHDSQELKKRKSVEYMVTVRTQEKNVQKCIPKKIKIECIRKDTAVIALCLNLFPWADFRKEKGGIKLTIKLDHQGKIPCFALITNAREHDVKGIKEVPYEVGDVLVFYQGYADYKYFESICSKKAWFVTRLEKNAVYKYGKKRDVKSWSNIVSDYEIIIPSLSEEITLRKIIVRDPETKKKIVLLTNNLQWSSATIAGIYKDRWQIELFFKALKQNLKIKRSYGSSKNAVITQIWIALITNLLFYILKQKSKCWELSFTNFISVIKTMLFQHVCLYD